MGGICTGKLTQIRKKKSYFEGYLGMQTGEARGQTTTNPPISRWPALPTQTQSAETYFRDMFHILDQRHNNSLAYETAGEGNTKSGKVWGWLLSSDQPFEGKVSKSVVRSVFVSDE